MFFDVFCCFRCSRLGEELSSSLRMFSLDLVAMVVQFVGRPSPTPGSSPAKLFDFIVAKLEHEYSTSIWGLAVAPDNNIWIGAGQLRVHNAEGKQLFEPAIAKSVRDPYGMAFDKTRERAYLVDHQDEGSVWVCDLQGNGPLQQFNLGAGAAESSSSPDLLQEHTPRFKWPLQEDAPMFKWPWSVAVNPNGNGEIFVTDNHTLRVLDQKGRVLRQCGAEGRGQGEFGIPSFVAFTPAGEVAVLEYHNDRIQVSCISVLFLWLRSHLSILILWCVLADSQIFDTDLKHLRSFGDAYGGWGLHKSGSKGFQGARGMAIDSWPGNFYVADTNGRRVVVLDPDGIFVTDFAERINVNCVALDYDGRILVAGDRVVHVFAFEYEDARATKV